MDGNILSLTACMNWLKQPKVFLECSYICADLLSTREGSPSKGGVHLHSLLTSLNPPLFVVTFMNTVNRFSSSLNVMVGYLCVQRLPEWL